MPNKHVGVSPLAPPETALREAPSLGTTCQKLPDSPGTQTLLLKGIWRTSPSERSGWAAGIDPTLSEDLHLRDGTEVDLTPKDHSEQAFALRSLTSETLVSTSLLEKGISGETVLAENKSPTSF